MHARSNNSETTCVLLGCSSNCLADYRIKALCNIAFVKIYSVIHLIVALADAKLEFCLLEKGRDSKCQVSKGFVKCVMVIQIPVIQQNCGRVQKTKKRH